MNNKSIPNFIIIGGQRCGTTWLYRALKKHPDIFFPNKKELHFFNGKDHSNISAYQKHFEEGLDYIAVGEATPDYLANEKVPERIFNYSPDIKFIVILRNPVERAYSAFWIFRKYFQGHTFESAIDNSPALLTSGEYARYLNIWFNFFPREQFHIVLYEQLVKDEQNVLKNIGNFLDVSEFTEEYIDKEKQVVNAAIFPRFQRFLTQMHLEVLVDLVKKTPLDPLMRKVYAEKNIGKYPKMRKKTEDRLYHYYSESNTDLQKLINEDLDSWFK